MALLGHIAADLTAIFAILMTLLIIYFRKKYRYWEDQGVASPPTCGPFGNLMDSILKRRTVGEIFRDIYFEFKRKGFQFAGIYLMAGPIFFLIDLELIKNILSKDFHYFTDRFFPVDKEIDPLFCHLFNMKGEEWKNLRIKLTPAFTSGKMKMMFHTVLACADELKNVVNQDIGRRAPIDIKDVSGRFTMDVIGSCAFGIECNSLKEPDNDFRRYGKRIFEQSVGDVARALLALCFPKLRKILKVPILPKEISDFFFQLVKDTVDYREENKLRRNDFLQLLIDMKKEDGEIESEEVGTKLTLESIAAQSLLFYFAGFETSSTTMTFCLYELSENVEIQNKVRNEVLHTLKKYGGKITYDGLAEMGFLNNVISETLRKHPPATFLSRRCTSDYLVPDTDLIVSKDTDVIIPVLGIHWDPEYYPDPERFDPDRFDEENKASRPFYAYLPFGDGPRHCIGLRFGLLQTKIGLVTLLSNYRLTLNNKTKVPLVMDPKGIILSVKGDIWLNAEPLYKSI